MAQVSDLVSMYIEACSEVNAAKETLETLSERKRALSEKVVSAFSEEGIEKMSLEGKTVYIHRQLWAKLAEGKTKEEGVSALKRAKLGDLVSEQWNASQLSSLLREREREGKELYKALEDVFVFNPTYEARVVASGKGG